MRLRLIVLFLAGGLLLDAAAQTDPDFESVLNAYIKEDNVRLDDRKLDRIVRGWEGSRSMDGIRSMVAEILKPTGGERRSRTYAMLQRSEVPREKIVSYLLESANKDAGDPDRVFRYFVLFVAYFEDDRPLQFLGALLDDKRLPDSGPESGRGGEILAEEAWRICDAAHGAIIQILERRGEIKPGDPGYGDPGGEATTGRRDSNIQVLRAVLVKAGYLNLGNADLKSAQTLTAPQPGQKPEVVNSSEPVVAVEGGGGKMAETAANRSVDSSDTRGRTVLWVLVPVAAAVIGLFIWKRRT